ncbi:PQQ-dependent dehydrogenase, methanol/ethanol family [Arenicella xantha]|uniref:Quinohemoprotein ethanol dehydrogenase n=1 Tax=Arenicella xantha TaxID=644221 RepID=A0A395JN58_9GAMM|nr:PQQ-dependent dehydrogenase, methanol/ethanol family [Arenicella xantha]RBP52723.1 quinohemoprotein ethanol dehydrogenase [Arenicella xantha]
MRLFKCQLNAVRSVGLSLAVIVGLSACSSEPLEPNIASVDTAPKGSVEHVQKVSAITDSDLVTADSNAADWLSYGRTYSEDRYSPLKQITRESLDSLGLAWSLELGTKRGIQSTPVVVDGIMYFTGPWSVVWAVDARNGAVLWKYDPEVPTAMASKLCCGVINRGVAIYQGAVFFGTLDGRLISLEASSGRINWSVQTVPEDGFYSITGAPRIVNGRVLIGNGGAEFKARGFVTAYAADTGEQVWRFYTVPGNPADGFEQPELALAAKTWNGEWWKQGGGGTVWDAINYDPELNLVYIGVGNGSHWNREIRSPGGGDNLYLSSIVALDADTGEYRWHFQTTPGDSWDYTATQPIILADLEIDGEPRKVLMQAPKNGFFYVIDRVTGEFISGDNYVYQNWTTGLDANGRPIEAEGARYLSGKAHWLTPGPLGGHNWFPMAFNRDTGLVYIPTGHQSMAYSYRADVGYASHEVPFGPLGGNMSLDGKLYNEPVFDPKAPPPGQRSGRLIAYDPIKHEEVWGIDQPFFYNGGVLTTAAGLVMQGDAEGIFSIRDASTGEAVWQYDVRSGVLAPPITYAVDGEQYISLLVGWGGSQGLLAKAVDKLYPGTLYTWKLGGSAVAPAKQASDMAALTELTTDADLIAVGRGFNHFINVCSGCHELGAGGGAVPDIARSSDAVFSIYEDIVLKGALASQGMPNLGAVLNQQELADIKAYVLYHAARLRAGVDPMALMAELGGLQYQADQATRSKTPVNNVKP